MTFRTWLRVMATLTSIRLRRKTKVIGVGMRTVPTLHQISQCRINKGIHSCRDWTSPDQTQMISGERWWHRRKATRIASLQACKADWARQVVSGRKSRARRTMMSLRSQNQRANQHLNQSLQPGKVKMREGILKSLASQKRNHNPAQSKAVWKAVSKAMLKRIISQRPTLQWLINKTRILHRTEMVHFLYKKTLRYRLLRRTRNQQRS